MCYHCSRRPDMNSDPDSRKNRSYDEPITNPPPQKNRGMIQFRDTVSLNDQIILLKFTRSSAEHEKDKPHIPKCVQLSSCRVH